MADGLVLGTGEATLEVPVWSPDGTRLAIAHPCDGTWAIDLANPAGDSAHAAVPAAIPRSPDGSLVAYKGALRMRTPGVSGRCRRWSPASLDAAADDRRRRVLVAAVVTRRTDSIAYFSGLAAPVMCGRSVPTGPTSVLIGGLATSTAPRTHLDGSRIAFDRTVETADIVRFVVAPADLSSELVLESPPMWGLQPVWALEGDWLLGYRADDGVRITVARASYQ
ncbi:MAG: hypothetical protein R3C32_07845 [Chloroflexota bacterium]